MKSVFLAASLLACVLGAEGQVTTTLNRLPDGLTEIKVRNDSKVDLVAFAVMANARGRVERAVAAYYEPPMTPLKPGEERTVKVSVLCGGGPPQVIQVFRGQNAKNSLCEFDQPIVAGIFADGSTSGDAPLLSRMMLRRSSTLLAVVTTLDILSDAGRHNADRDQLVDRFQKMADSLNRWYLFPEQEAGREIYQTMAGKLKNLPEAPAGSAFPPDSFVQRETAALREQRQVLIEALPSSLSAPEKPILLSFGQTLTAR
jgi:hypothetical protein